LAAYVIPFDIFATEIARGSPVLRRPVFNGVDDEEIERAIVGAVSSLSEVACGWRLSI